MILAKNMTIAAPQKTEYLDLIIDQTSKVDVTRQPKIHKSLWLSKAFVKLKVFEH